MPAWYTGGKQTNKPPGPPAPHWQSMARARMLEDFAALIEALGWPAWRVRLERELAGRCWQAAQAAFEAYRRSLKPVQLVLFEEESDDSHSLAKFGLPTRRAWVFCG